MRSASPSLRQALADSPFVFDGGPAWRAENALDAAARSGVEDQVSIAHRELNQAMEPAPAQWFGKRLPVLWTLFMAARQADPRALTVWMAETAHLLGDVPTTSSRTRSMKPSRLADMASFRPWARSGRLLIR